MGGGAAGGGLTMIEDLVVEEAILKLKDSERSRLTILESAIVCGVVGSMIVACVSLVWLLFVSAVYLTMKVLGV